MRLGAVARIEAKKVEIGRIKERVNVAKKENREADRARLEAERKAAEREIELLRCREELRRPRSSSRQAGRAGRTDRDKHCSWSCSWQPGGRDGHGPRLVGPEGPAWTE